MSMAERQAAKLRTQYEDAEKNRLLYENEVLRLILIGFKTHSFSCFSCPA